MDKDNNDSKKPAGRARKKQLFDSLHQEMEIAQYSTSETGQQRRKVPRKESAVRNKKRKILEKADHQERSVTGDSSSQRMRGSRKSLGDDVIHASQVYAEEAKADLDEEDDEEGMEVEVNEELIEEEEADEEVGDDEGEEGDDEEVAKGNEKAASAKASEKRPAGQKTKKKRLMYRMSNFKSARMAERHGDALGAHARGQSLQAVRKLEQVAVDAPAAPQVYSSLGMVYESLLSDSRKKKEDGETQEKENTIKAIEKQLDLAKKAYGSYHVAALLCKKDFSLWVRAGDTAKEIADLYTEAMASSETQAQKREEYREEKRKWIEEARKDYLAADNQRPPGIDVPAKLAAAQMELGNLSEALVILTDLKNRSAATDEARSEFEKSYKAWLLYADLMLRIGHECTQWNEGNQKNKNYMFRRWLRKWSDSFGWKERRLQALVQALEAAAGSKCCENLIAWSKNRASNAAAGKEGDKAPSDQRRWHVDMYEIAKDPPDAKQGEEEGKEGDETAEKTQKGSAGESSAWSLDRAREALLAKNRLELKVFDEETKKLPLARVSNGLQERANARTALIATHRKSVVDLIGNYHQHQAAIETAVAAAAGTNTHAGDIGNSETATEPLPISASCAAVCSIASELMKHCLRFELFDGCRLVGESVSAYLKERAELLERRLEANRSFAEKQKSTAESVLLSMETYDEVGDDESDDDADAVYLSDDEIILDSSDEHLVPSLKNGILPPELRLLYALSLIAEGGRAFLARQCIKAIEVLEADDIDALVSDPVDTDIVKDPLWYSFRQDLTEPLQKTAAFAFTIDALQKAKKEAEYADLVTPLLNKHLEHLESSGEMDVALFGNESAKLGIPTRNRVIRLILASARMQIEHVMSSASAQEQEVVESAMSVLDRVIPMLQKFWKVERENGSIPSFCIEGMALLAKTFSILTELGNDAETKPRILAKLLEVLSLLCGIVLPDPLNYVLLNDEDPFRYSPGFPIKAGWQNVSHQYLSKRLYNLAVGCVVSNFSGWETDEFNVDLLRASKDKRHFGVNISGERVTGYLLPSAENDLIDQWQQITTLLPQFSDFDFKSKLDSAKSSAWYKDVVEDMDKIDVSLTAYGEKDALALFMTLSRLCLKAASSVESDAAKYGLIKLALSVVLPLSEFCLDMNLWETPVGKAAISKTARMYDWNKLAKSVGQRDGDGYAARRPRTQPVKRIEPTKRRPLPTMIRIPVSALLSEWNDGSPTKRIDSEEAKEAMRKVDEATKQLRACYSETAIQKGCIRVALALMDLVTKGYCYNPFLCLQQAVIFAAQGSKGGKNDEPFKAGLPKEKECTPQEAVVIIGRADCLQSLHFADEAIYLCSYVARVCRLHRDRQETQLAWNSKWKVVGICLYNLSVAIRTTRSFQDENSNPEYWSESVVEELKCGRVDAIALKESLPETVAAVSDEAEGELNDDEDHFDDNNQEHVIGESYAEGDVEMMEVDGEFESGGMMESDEEERQVVAV